MAISADELAQVNPAVLSAGGSSVDLLGLILTNSTASPLGTVPSFPDAASVGAYYGLASVEYQLAGYYFNGFVNSTKKPSALLFSQYPTAPVAAYLRSGSLASMTLAQIQAIAPGTLTITVDGTVKTSSSINLGAATSPSNAATLIAAAFTGGPAVTYNAQLKTFDFTSTTTGAASTITFGSGPISAALLTTSATGAVLSQGSVAATPAAAMTSITGVTLSWTSFMTTFEPLLADKIAFGTWTAQQNNKFAYVAWDTDVNAIVSGDTTSFGPQVTALNLTGSVPIYKDPNVAAFVLGAAASLDFSQTNGRTTFGYMVGAGLVASVTDRTVYRNLTANGYNCYAQFATSADKRTMYQKGSIGGAFKWQDSYMGQIKLNSALQIALIDFMQGIGSNPYNLSGYTALELAMAGPINDALNFGTIRTGVTLSTGQKANVNAAAGKQIDTVLSTRGWYLLIGDATPEVRAVRGSPPMKLFYMDGGSMQQLTLASVAVQ